MHTTQLVPCIKLAIERNPQQTLTDYINTVAHTPQGNDLRWKDERQKARIVLNREIEDGALTEHGRLIWWEEHHKLPGQPRSNAPKWASGAIASNRIKKPIVEPPVEPPATEGLSDQLTGLLEHITQMTAGTKYASRVNRFAERLALEGSEDLAIEGLNVLGSVVNALMVGEKVISVQDKNGDLYEHRIVEMREAHEKEKRLLAYEPQPIVGGATLHRKQ